MKLRGTGGLAAGLEVGAPAGAVSEGNCDIVNSQNALAKGVNIRPQIYSPLVEGIVFLDVLGCADKE